MAFLNPVLRGWNPDPSVCRVGADYYLATSTFMYAPGVPIYHSTDLINWHLVGHALEHTGSLDFSRPGCKNQIFAPTLRWHAGRFYLVTTDVNGIGNFMVSAENPAGPWSDPVVIDTGLFDPSLLFDDDGTVYYTRRGKTGILDEHVRNEALLEETDDWTGPNLDGRWITIRRPPAGSVHPGSTGLKLACLPGGLRSETPVLLARRLTAFDFEAETTVSLEPSPDSMNAGTGRTEAGVCLYLDRNHWYAAAIASSGSLVLRKRIEDMETIAAELPLSPGTKTLRLGIRGHDEGFEFFWALPGQKEWQLLGTASARLLWPELASVWTGTVIGVWAFQNRESDLLQQKTESETLAPEAPFALFKAWSYRETLAHWWKMDGSIPGRLTDGDEE